MPQYQPLPNNPPTLLPPAGGHHFKGVGNLLRLYLRHEWLAKKLDPAAPADCLPKRWAAEHPEAPLRKFLDQDIPSRCVLVGHGLVTYEQVGAVGPSLVVFPRCHVFLQCQQEGCHLRAACAGHARVCCCMGAVGLRPVCLRVLQHWMSSHARAWFGCSFLLNCCCPLPHVGFPRCPSRTTTGTAASSSAPTSTSLPTSEWAGLLN